MTKKLRLPLVAAGIALALTYSAARASTHDFFREKTIRIVVGYAPGGGFDVYSRVIARHMHKHIPGNPVMIVENMPGAAGLLSANYLYNKAKPDGLTIGNWIGGLILQQYLGTKGVEYDAGKFEWIGAPVRINNVCILTKRSGITGVDKWLASKTPVKIGGEGPGSTTADIPRVLMKYTKLPIQLIEGYKGTAPIRLAAEGGEVAGVCASWEGLRPPWLRALESGDVVVVLQLVPKPHLDLPNVPLAAGFIESDEGRQVLKTVVQDIGGTINRPYSLPPGTPKDRIQILRQAFQTTIKDPEFLVDARKSKLDITPVSGEEVEKIVADIKSLPPSIFARIKEIFGP